MAMGRNVGERKKSVFCTTAKTQSENISLTKDANSGDYAAVYTFTSYNGTQTKINIPKE